MKNISILNPAVGTANLGDDIIIESVKDHLNRIFNDSDFYDLPTHSYLNSGNYREINKSDYVFVGGTNLLSSNMLLYNQWKINYKDYFKLKKVILMGVGWWQYQKDPDLYTRVLLRKVLHKEYLHSVRDSYTLEKLKAMGILNAVNTGCPTMWDLNKEHCRNIPQNKAETVLMTITD